MNAQVRWVTAFLDTPATDAGAAEAFWCDVTGYRVSERRGDLDQFSSLVPADGDPHLKFQTVGVPTPGGLHLDLHTEEVDALVARAQRLGAGARPADGYVVCRSPAGFSFCVVPYEASTSAPAGLRSAAPVGWPQGRSKVDQVSIDVPQSQWQSECCFWVDVTGWALVELSASKVYRRLRRPDGLSIQLLLQRLDDDPLEGARGHLDLGSDDYLAETERHVALGAREVRRTEHWVTLLDPSGRTYCVTRHAVDEPAA